MKKVIIIAVSLVIFTIISLIILNTGSNANVLYLLNWGEYINEDVVKEFENEYNCLVIEETVTSSETMYQKVTAGTTGYDVAIPGDYMVNKMYQEGLLEKLDVNNEDLEMLNASFSQEESIFNATLQTLIENPKNGLNDKKDYFRPYFWGAYSIIYNTSNKSTESIVKNNGFGALFDRNLYDFDVKIGMYNTARWAVAAYQMYQNQDVNAENLDINKISSDIKKAKFDVWGDDQLKRKTAIGDLDLCFTQLGDFFDALYLTLDENNYSGQNGTEILNKVKFNVNIPSNSAAFFDAMVIPTTTQNKTLANQFINFMLRTEHAFDNATAIGYCPTLKEVAECYQSPEKLQEVFKDGAQDRSYYYFVDENSNRNITLKEFVDYYPQYLNPLGTDTNIENSLFEPKDSDYMTMCEKIVNQAKSDVSPNSNLGTIICYGVLSVVGVSIITYIAFILVKNKKKNERVSK